ncbi:MAG: histidinol-phosphate transaminase [Candidatus Makaraimicrobium thalassicum]|nr:MAG: histidinol-phosphate transaminase [Candidatus Omnitrophota bacterium]
MKKIWKDILDEITPYKPGKPVEEVKRELGLENVIKLASNENAIEPSPRVIEAITRAAGSVNRYPDGGCFYLRQVLSGKLSVPGDNIVFGNGSDEIIVQALRAFVNPGDEVIISDPTFLIYRIAALIEGAEVRTIPAKDYRHDLDAMLGAVTSRTRVIFIANPDNPTGSHITRDELEGFIERIPEDVLVFMDEAYYEFARGGDYPETRGLIEREDRNIIIARTFSKAYGLAGLRVGYGLARKDIARALDKVREPFNVNSIAQAAAVAALEDSEYVAASLALVRTEKRRFYEAFAPLDVSPVPSWTNFILVDTGRDSMKMFDYLLRRGVIVREMSAWGLDGCIRVNIGLREENDMFLKVFEEAVTEIPREKEIK